ncbi:12391_t:CDS:2, partial [Funneliformis geosporum]
TATTEEEDISLEIQLQIIENFFEKNTNWLLIKFLNYRAKDDEFTYDKRKEHLLYKSVLSLLSKDYAQAQKYLSSFEAYAIAITQLDAYVPTSYQTSCHVMNEKTSEVVNIFWNSIDKKLCDSKIEHVETNYDLGIATEVTQQMETYIKSSTTRVTKRFSNSCQTNPLKHLAQVSTCYYYRRDYSESISNSSEEEDHVDDETHKRSKRKVGNDSEGLQESMEDDLYFVSEHVPCFGLDFNEVLNHHVNREILEIYNNAKQCDPIKMGVINLEDIKKNQTRPFKVISEIFKKDFRNNDINSKVKMMLREIGDISDISDAKDFLSKYIQELLSFNFDTA